MISILTPTYNRAHTLMRLYDSLVAQSDQDLEWVVVDDGSTDGTGHLLRLLSARAEISMTVVTQVNSGKHLAVNAGVFAAKGEWIFIVDSDDLLTEDAVSAVSAGINITLHKYPLGVCFRKASFSQNLWGREISNSFTDFAYIHPTDAAHLYRGDLAYVFRKTALSACPFPSFIGENFVPEMLVWNRIGDKGLIAYFHRQVVYLAEYLPDGYSANFRANIRRNPRGFRAFYAQQFFREHSALPKLKCAVRVVQCMCFSVLRRLDK